MLEEDLMGQASLEQQLVMRREEIENYMSQIKQSLPSGIVWSPELQKQAQSTTGSDSIIMQIIMNQQTRELLKGLVREL